MGSVKWSEVVRKIWGPGLSGSGKSRCQGSNMGPSGGRVKAPPVGSVPSTLGKQATSPRSD